MKTFVEFVGKNSTFQIFNFSTKGYRKILVSGKILKAFLECKKINSNKNTNYINLHAQR